MQPFHLAIPVHDIPKARAFYTQLLGCRVGRESDRWIDFDFYGHQLVVHLVDSPDSKRPTNPVDGKQVPVPHFGLVLGWEEWHTLVTHLKKNSIAFVIEPYVRFEGEPGEQATLFLADPSGNAIEMKSFKDPSQLFATRS